MKPIYKILTEPYVTEKTSEFLMDEEAGSFKYAFKVALNANKFEIKSAIEKQFDVKVDTVKTVVVRGKEKRMRQVAGYTPKWKKAYIKLKPGHNISEFEGA
jgi:large subunit ribosomal protein L23